MFEKLHQTARRILTLARWEASKLGRGEIDSEALLLGILNADDEATCELLKKLNIRPEAVRWQISGTRVRIGQLSTVAQLPLSPDGREILELADDEAGSMAEAQPRPEHLLLGILRLGTCRAAVVLEEHGVDLEGVRGLVREKAARKPGAEALAAMRYPQLSEYGYELVERAARNAFDPLIGRRHEVSLLVRILSQRIKRNPLMVGEPGVGKTAIVEGLAQRIADGEVPSFLADKKIFILELGSVVAGTKYRGQFEERLRRIVAELRDHPEVIVFIDEIHGLIGAGAVEGSLDAANILKPAISRGEVSLIGATTLAEFRKYVEKDRSLLRRFQAVKVDEPSPEQTLEILAGLRPRYEAFHQVRYRRGALDAAVELSSRYIAERFLPDKAIDVLDAAGANAKLRAEADNDDRPEVRRADVEEVVSSSTGVPVSRMRTDEAERLARMEKVLGERVVGQATALSAISRAIRRSRLRIGSANRPIGSFLFLGPSGVGKTEVARRLSEFLFDSDRALLRFDMSEYMERHAVSRLIGSPPGYVGYDEGGQLTEQVRRQPYSLILFDEIEKAHPEVPNLLLQVLEDGWLTDSNGTRVDFRNTLILMTSNLGSHRLAEKTRVGFGAERQTQDADQVENEIMTELRRGFPPEFLSRLDEVIVFNPLGRDELKAIVDLLLRDLESVLGEQQLEMEVSDAARDWLLDNAGIDPSTGARPLRRAIQTHVEDEISSYLIEHHGLEISRLSVDLNGDGLAVSH